MPFPRLAFDAALSDYDRHSADLLDAHAAGDREALSIFHHNHPRFLDEKVVWLPKRLSAEDIAGAALSPDDARLCLARWYCFRDWPALGEYAESIRRDASVFRFESAVEAVIDGELERLQALLAAYPELVHARSTRVTKFDPPVHRAALLHYVAANGVEDYRQRTPPNAPAIARALLQAGADPNAKADLYGGSWETMGLLVSSSHPAEAGVQAELVDVLADFGAAVEGTGRSSPLIAALVHGHPKAAHALVRRGAPVNRLDVAAGLGRVAEFMELLPSSATQERHQALALSAQLGEAPIVERLLDAGEDPNRFNPEGFHAHATPLHQAALAGHEDVVRLLAAHGARLDILDTIHHSDPLGWAEYSGQHAVADFLRSLQPPR